MTLNKLIVNPYVLYMKETSDPCKPLETDSGFVATCTSNPSKVGYIDLASTFSGYGLILA